MRFLAPSPRGPRWRLRFGLWLALRLVALAAVAARAEPEGALLTTARQIRELSMAALATAPAARIRGVITFHEPETGLTFVQDETAGLAVQAGVPSRLPREVRVGSRVELRGVAAVGTFAPVITGRDGGAPEVGWTDAPPAPAPRPLALGAEELAQGRFDGCWIELHGTVRSLEVKSYHPDDVVRSEDAGAEEGPPVATRISIELGTVAGRFTIVIPWQAGRPPPMELLEARVRVRAVLGSITNLRRQWVGALLYVPSLAEVVVERPPVMDPFRLPLQETSDILRFSAVRPEEERVRVQGAVTLLQPRFRFYISSPAGPLEVQTHHPQGELRLGSRVDVVGYPTLVGSRVVLQNAVFRVLAQGEVPAPRLTTRSAALTQYLDGELVRLTGRFFQATLRGTNRILLVEVEGGLIEVAFTTTLSPEDARLVQNLRSGAELALTGIALVQGATQWNGGMRSTALNLLLRNVEDIVVLRQPSWWTAARLLALVGVLLILILLGLVWVYLLRRRVEQQTATIRQNLQREAVWEERSRIARDIHDDVGAALTQISLLGELGRREGLPATDVRGQLEKIAHQAREAVRSLDEIVWTVNPRNDTVMRASSYFCQAVQDMLGGTLIRCRLQVPDDLPEVGLGAKTRHNLFLAVKEAVNNAIKHSGATELRLILAATPGRFELRLEDDGRGFDPAQTNPLRSGLGNLRRRLEDVGGSCEIHSEPGRGTTVRLVVPTTGYSTSNAG